MSSFRGIHPHPTDARDVPPGTPKQPRSHDDEAEQSFRKHQRGVFTAPRNTPRNLPRPIPTLDQRLGGQRERLDSEERGGVYQIAISEGEGRGLWGSVEMQQRGGKVVQESAEGECNGGFEEVGQGDLGRDPRGRGGGWEGV